MAGRPGCNLPINGHPEIEETDKRASPEPCRVLQRNRRAGAAFGRHSTIPAMRTLLPVLALALAACDGGAAREPEDTWTVVSRRILEPTCAGACHAAGTSMAAQSGLVLTPDVAYEQLVGVQPTNPAARAAGLLRVHGTPGVDLHDHFLWEKVNAPESEHLLDEHPGYGAPMPLGGEALTYGELAFLRSWLVAGAPRTGIVADEVLLADTARWRPGAFEPLQDLASADGWSIRLGPFPVAPRFEREFFHYLERPDADERLVNRMEITMRTGSHHFILYGFPAGTPASALPQPGAYRDLRLPNGSLDLGVMREMASHVFYGGTQWPRMDYRFPEGTALRLPPGMGFDLNSHYVNRGEAPATGEVHVNLHWAEPGAVRHVAEVLNLNNLDLTLPPNRETTISRAFTFTERRHVFQLFSHAHKRMRRFDVFVVGGSRDGERIYRATDWEHPPILELDPPLVLEPGQGLRLEATYFNETNRTIRFGFSSEDEMMIVFGYYHTD